jgi:L-fuconate dehydratase
MWDLFTKREGKPLWRLLADMSPEQLVALVDWRYLGDALGPEEAVELLRAQEPTRAQREKYLVEHGLPACTTSAGWLGYGDEKLRQLCHEAADLRWSHHALEVGADIEDDVRRCRIAREVLGPRRTLMVDANQAWDVGAAITNTRRLAEFDPWWIEEPTSPDDVLGHAAVARAVAPVLVATGEHVHDRVMFEHLLQSGALGVCQIDACRLGGVNEVVAVLLLAARFGVPVCPHAGGVGPCELVQHLSAFDLVAVSGSLDGVVVEYVDHLHQHFTDPVQLRAGRYVPPERPGCSAEMRRGSLRDHAFPHGPVWAVAR